MKSKITIFLAFVLSQFSVVLGQHNTPGSLQNLAPLDKTSSHYATLISLDERSNSERAWMDTISYPQELYHDHTILYTLISPVYLRDSQIDQLKKNLKFPKNSSDQTRAELNFLLKLQKERTPEQEERVMELAKIGYWPGVNQVKSHPNYLQNENYLFFEVQEILGERYRAENFPATSKLLKGIMNDMRLMEFTVKYELLRARPYQLEPGLLPLKKIQSPSFVSGHTLWAYIQAYTLGALVPEKRQDFIQLAYEIGLSREIMGVHYPSDEEMARRLAHQMLVKMWENKEFEQDFLIAQKEWSTWSF